MKAKRLLALLLSILLLVSSMPVVFADEAPAETVENETYDAAATSGTCGEDGDNVTWKLENGTLTVSGTGKIDSYVTKDPPWFDLESDIQSVVIENGVTAVGVRAFSHCTAMQTLTLPQSLTFIDGVAFYYCTALKSVTIPGSVKEIEANAFTDCHALTSVTFQNGVQRIGDEAFASCKTLTSVTIPNSVTYIGEWAFNDCPALKSVTIPKSVTMIDEEAFGYYFAPNTVLKVPGFTISGYTGTAAEKYAKENGFTFKALDAATKPETKLSTPQLSSVKNTSSGIQFTWQKVSGAEKYRVYFKTGNGGWKKIGDTAKTSYTRKDANLKGGTKYTFTVKAVKGNTTSSYDKTGKAITYVKQSNVSKVENTTTGVKITWKKSSGAAKYTLYYKTTGGWKKIGTTAKTSYTWTKAKPGTRYTFTIKALAKDGSAASYNNGKSITYLAAPTKLAAAKSGSTGIKVSWAKISGAAKYRVYYKTTGGWKKLKDVTSTSYTWTKGKKGTKYTFTVRAIAKGGKTMSAYDTKGKSAKL